tara:strand:- start:115 stop:438 length:324 start_codon:yes stop_codon:yes gene_type:complete
MKMKLRTKTYRCTLPNNEKGEAHFQELCAINRYENAVERGFAKNNPSYVPKIHKVFRKGRLGKNSPHAAKYKSTAHPRNAYALYNPYQNIPVADSATYDVYRALRND